jgi:hypothetical protein
MSISTLSNLGEDFGGDDHVVGLHAELTYEDVAAAGPPARPLDFPAPCVHRCHKIDIHARDHRSGTIHFLRNVLVRSEDSERAYFVTKKLTRTVYGSIRLCIVLRRRVTLSDANVEEREDSPSNQPQIEWESTDLQAAVKISEFSKIHAMRGRHLEDPIKEISTLQLLGNYHPHVLGAFDVLQDDNFLYTFTRYLPGGELYGRLEEGFPRRKMPDEELEGKGVYSYDESKARAWFKQLVKASFTWEADNERLLTIMFLCFVPLFSCNRHWIITTRKGLPTRTFALKTSFWTRKTEWFWWILV